MKQYPLYDAQMEHESCGVGAVVDLSGQRSHKTVSDALTIVERLAHRAGCDALGTTGDGVGVLTQLPHALFAAWAAENGWKLGDAGDYGVGMLFVPENLEMEQVRRAMEAAAAQEGLRLICWRDVPCRPEILGEGARRTMPAIAQCFVQRPEDVPQGLPFDRKLYVLRRSFEKKNTGAYVCSLSSRTIVYKGMMLVTQLRTFYDDLRSADYTSALAMVHSRFSTNTEPSWPKAHPHRMLLHNGEINTIRGNADRMLAREETMHSNALDAAMEKVYPVVQVGGSDSMMLDNTMEFLTMNGMPLPLAGMVLLPEPWQGKSYDTPWKDLYRYYATMMEPWDGPAAVLYSDGDVVCASLDRNGLRPMRCTLTKDNRLILSSEAGVLYEENENIVRRWRLRAGDLLMADLRSGRFAGAEEIKKEYAGVLPYGDWLRKGVHSLGDLKQPARRAKEYSDSERTQLCKAFGFTHEDVRDVLMAMAEKGGEPIASMGADEPIAALSRRHPPLSSYFKQRFAQVTNPPIDALREKLKTDCSVYVGDDGNLLEPTAENCRVLELETPILTCAELEQIREMDLPGFQVETVSLLYGRETSLEDAVEGMFRACDAAYEGGANVVILSDRGVDKDHMAIPSLLAVSALEQHLIRSKRRTAVSVILESGEPRDTHQLAALIGYGARAVNPYLSQACIADLCKKGALKLDADAAIANYNKALTAGILHIASKMGVSTIQAYQSAQLFECIGLDHDLVDKYFTNTPCRLSGVNLAHLEEAVRWHHDHAFVTDGADLDPTLDSVGLHRLRTGKLAEEHLYTPEVVHTLQQAVWNDDYALFERYSDLILKDGSRTIRSLLDFRFEDCTAIPLSEVEPASEIVHRFKTGAMSYGSLSQEAHECMAEAMNHIGGKSNTGEGGELPERFGTKLNSAIKQVASGRFGVTEEYLLSANEIQIKMAQGAKPGEGGHLPGAKVKPWVARTRCSTPGISLISPPPHHDIYSIEDLAQLIYDLKCANRDARISVKLVSETGVGTVASGVAKAGAQVILISGGEGGTGAAPLTSIHGAGLPWELGLAEAHQVLCKNGLREMVALETDGKLMTGRDVAVAMLLGAEEFAFATAPLVTMGCRMMRVCSLDSCPFGIATQNPELRKRFIGKPEYVERFMFFVAEQLRSIMAKLGARSVDELVGRADLLKIKDESPLDLTELTAFSENRHCIKQKAYDFKLDSRADASVPQEHAVLRNTDRSFGTLLGAAMLKAQPHGQQRTLDVQGCGGQSFGAFLPQNLALRLTGEANDYLGKGLSGGTIAVCPPDDGSWNSGDALIGNVALYGATKGEVYIAGTAGERFCVRNSGATAVAEGVGDNGCEYMTGGRAVILGSVGDNFAAGMSGGLAYVLDEDGALAGRLNRAMVGVEAVSGEGAQELRGILENHLRWTGSPKARAILADFEASLARFKLIIPTEYKKLLEGR